VAIFQHHVIVEAVLRACRFPIVNPVSFVPLISRFPCDSSYNAVCSILCLNSHILIRRNLRTSCRGDKGLSAPILSPRISCCFPPYLCQKNRASLKLHYLSLAYRSYMSMNPIEEPSSSMELPPEHPSGSRNPFLTENLNNFFGAIHSQLAHSFVLFVWSSEPGDSRLRPAPEVQHLRWRPSCMNRHICSSTSII
jgi:hypothetical protein